MSEGYDVGSRLGIALRSCILGFGRPNWRCAVLRPAFAKVVTMFPGVM